MAVLEGSREELEKARQRREKENSIMALMDSIKDDSTIFERIVDRLVSEYCYELDEYVKNLDSILRDIRRGRIKRYSELQLEIRSLELATKMYKATDGIAVLGSQSDVAKNRRKSKFDAIYATLKGPGTIPDKTAEANSLLGEDLLVESITERALKVVTQKLKNANRILEALKKVLTSQMIAKEVWRKEAPIYDMIEGEYSDDLDTVTKEDPDGDGI